MRERLGDFSVREKNLWLELLVDVVVAVYYYPRMFALFKQGDEALTGAAMTGLIVNTIILAIVTVSILHGFLHTKSKPEAKDERDHKIDASSNLWASRFLVALILGVIVLIVLQELTPWEQGVPFTLTPLVLANCLLITLMLSSLVESLAKIFMYRRGYA